MKQSPIQHIIFDLTGVLFRSNKLKQFRSIGLLRSLLYVITHRKNPVMRFLHVLKKLHEQEPEGYPIIYYKHTPLPRCISDLMCGHINNEKAASIIDDHFQQLVLLDYFDSKQEVRLMKHIIQTLVATKQSIVALKPDKKIIKLIQNLKKQGYILYLLTNFDKASYANLLCKYPEIFAIFDNIIVSAHVHMLKPYEEIYRYLLEKYQINTDQCIFIDDQIENIRGAETIGIKGLHYTNFVDLVEYFKNYNIVTE